MSCNFKPGGAMFGELLPKKHNNLLCTNVEIRVENERFDSGPVYRMTADFASKDHSAIMREYERLTGKDVKVERTSSIKESFVDSVERLKKAFDLASESAAFFATEEPVRFRGLLNQIYKSELKSKSNTMKKYTYHFEFEVNEQRKSSSVSLFASGILDANKKFYTIYGDGCSIRVDESSCNGIKMEVTKVEVEKIAATAKK